jgi:hypothetical protein
MHVEPGARPAIRSVGAATASFHPAGGREHQLCVRELARRGVALPLPHRSEAIHFGRWADSTFVALRDSLGACCGGFSVHSRPVGQFPGARVRHVERLGAALPPELAEPAVSALVQLVRSEPLTLRMNVQIFSPDAGLRALWREALRRSEFEPLARMNGYAETLSLDLAPEEPQLFATIHATARRHVRAVAKGPLMVVPIEDARLAARMNALTRETLLRTGGRFAPRDWEEEVRFSTAFPELARLVGLFRTDRRDAESLIAFAWGCFHGDHAVYADGASTRPADLRVACKYPLMWDLVRWGKRAGAAWFDLGGITRGDDDSLGGISHFKRFFSRDLVRVAEEWVFHPPTLLAKGAARIHNYLLRPSS